MVKAKIKGKNVSFDQGVFNCSDPELLQLLELLSEEYDQTFHAYQPDPDFSRMTFITERLAGEITFADHPQQLDPKAEY